MLIKSIKIRNYKSFADSGTIELSPSFNVILGKNNSGKTGFLEGFRGPKNSSMPHRDLTMRPTAIADPNSEFHLEVEVLPEELFDTLMSMGNPVQIPVQTKQDGVSVAKRVFGSTEPIRAMMIYATNGRQPSPYPSHGLFVRTDDGTPKRLLHVSPKANRQGYDLRGPGEGDGDTLPNLIESVFDRRVFVFSAERLRLSRVSFDAQPALQSDASNLARALFEMQTNPTLWEEFNSNINLILPNVRRVIVASDTSSTIEVRVWPVETSSLRTDLVVKLIDSGTGVAQVMAILCAAMTLRQSVICIDEPGNFLHPGAIKALLAVLKQYDHQYVITTHSLDALVSANPSRVYFVEWNDCVSNISPRNLQNLEEHRGTLAELGLSLGDIFGMEHVVWVEGPTEELCVPIVAQHIFGHMPATHVVVRVRATAELLDKKPKDRAIWDIYNRLASAGGFVPTSANFLFDRESRNEQQIRDIERESNGTIKFLARRTFENYLLDETLLLAELNAEADKLKLTQIVDTDLQEWFEQNRGKFDCSADDELWVKKVDAPKLLNALFMNFIKSEYRKTLHSPSLTRRLLSNGGDVAIELQAAVRGAFGR